MVKIPNLGLLKMGNFGFLHSLIFSLLRGVKVKNEKKHVFQLTLKKAANLGNSFQIPKIWEKTVQMSYNMVI